MADQPSRSLTRREFDEVIRRATEIALDDSESGEGALSEAELFRISREVGLPERYVRKALAEVRSNAAPPDPGAGLLDRVFGPETVRASRLVPGDPSSLASSIDEFLVAGRLLQPVRKGGRVLHYRPAVDWISQVARAASATSRRYYVASAKSVDVRLEEVEPGRTLVEFEVDPGLRGDSVAGAVLGGGSAGAATGFGATFVVAMAAPLALAIPAGVAVGVTFFGGITWAVGHHQQGKLREVRTELEGLLDQLEHGESLEPPPPSWRRWVKRHFHGARRLMGSEEGGGDEWGF